MKLLIINKRKIALIVIYGTKNSTMDQVKFVEDSL